MNLFYADDRLKAKNTLVKAEIEDRTARIAIDGIEHARCNALSAIRYQLDEIREYERKQYGNVTNIHIDGNAGGHFVVGDSNDVQN